MRSLVLLCVATLGGISTTTAISDDPATSSIRGHYVESRSCDVFTGECVANGQVGLVGREALIAWHITDGAWQGVDLSGLSVIAAVKASNTLGDSYHNPYPAKAVVIVDADANLKQQEALTSIARNLGGELTMNVVAVKTAAINSEMGTCSEGGCASICAEGLAEVKTRCLKNGDHLCGNEKAYYPPLTAVRDAMPAVASVARYEGDGLGVTWNDVNRRSAFVGSF